MITYVTYQEVTFTSSAALSSALERAEAAGWSVSSLDRRGQRACVVFQFEQEVSSTGESARPELPEFETFRKARWSLAPLAAAIRRLAIPRRHSPRTTPTPVKIVGSHYSPRH